MSPTIYTNNSIAIIVSNITIELEECKKGTSGYTYYKCPICPHCFGKKERLKEHLLEEHGIKEDHIRDSNSNSSTNSSSNNSSSNNNNANKVIININTIDPEECKVNLNGFEFYRCPVCSPCYFKSLEGFNEHLLVMHAGWSTPSVNYASSLRDI